MQCRLEHLFSKLNYMLHYANMHVLCFFIPENINMKHMHNCTVQSCDLMCVCVRYASSRNAIITDRIPIIKLGQLQQLRMYRNLRIAHS